jgi:hypothetical protein
MNTTQLLCTVALALPILGLAPVPADAATTAAVQAEEETITVEAEGVGADRAAALDQALQAAIMSAVGGIIESETIVENEQLVKDRMRQLSGGVVQRYEILLDQKTAAGHVMRVKAKISRKPIVDVVGEIVEGSAKVSGKSLLAKRKSMKQAAGNLKETLIPPVRAMMEAPFTAHLSEDAFMNVIGLKLPESESGLLAPVVLSVDLARWNTSAATLVERLTAFGAPIESTEFNARGWSLQTKEAQQEMTLLNEQIKSGDPNAVQAAIAKGGPAITWTMRVVAEAATPPLRADQARGSSEMPYGAFTVSGFRQVTRGAGVDSVDNSGVGFTSDPDPTPAVLGIVHAIEGSKAKLTYFRLDADALTELRQSAVKGARIEISLVDDAGTAVTSESCALSYCPRRGAGMFLCDGTKAFAPGKPEPVLVLVPGGCEFGTVQNSFDASTASLKPVKVGGSQGFDTEWFGLLHFDFAEADIERAEEIRVKCAAVGIANPSR